MYDFDNMTLKEIRDLDLAIIKDWLEENRDDLSYDTYSESWFIGDEEIVDALYYDVYSIIHPKEIINYVEEIIEDEMEIKR